jgi:hypothetical protein
MVETALQSTPWILDAHTSVETGYGAVWPDGLTFDQWRLKRAYRDARSASGGKRIALDPEKELAQRDVDLIRRPFRKRHRAADQHRAKGDQRREGDEKRQVVPDWQAWPDRHVPG